MIDLCYQFDDRCMDANASCHDLFDHLILLHRLLFFLKSNYTLLLRTFQQQSSKPFLCNLVRTFPHLIHDFSYSSFLRPWRTIRSYIEKKRLMSCSMLSLCIQLQYLIWMYEQIDSKLCMWVGKNRGVVLICLELDIFLKRAFLLQAFVLWTNR